jgi:hypothetical protein
MKKTNRNAPTPEPIGIVISRGDAVETAPLFSAYVWGPAPEEVSEAKAHAA